MAEKRRIETEGRELFDEFLRQGEITQAVAARALDVSEVTVLHWRVGEKRPVEHQRAKIDVWTGGKVPVASWRTPEERAEVEQVQPFSVAQGAA